jgi:hypothetical protein
MAVTRRSSRFFSNISSQYSKKEDGSRDQSPDPLAEPDTMSADTITNEKNAINTLKSSRKRALPSESESENEESLGEASPKKRRRGAQNLAYVEVPNSSFKGKGKEPAKVCDFLLHLY